MPPKRKAATITEQVAPPAKRATRSRAVLAQTQPVVVTETITQPPHSKPRSTRTTRQTVQLEQVEPLKPPTAPPKRRGRPPKSAAKQVIPPASQGSEPSTSKVTLEALQQQLEHVNDNTEDGPDELLLVPAGSKRPITPPQSTGGRNGATPRYFLEAVEIATPSKRLRHPSTHDAASPGAHPSRSHISVQDLLASNRSPLRAQRTLPAEPISPSKIVVSRVGPPSPSRRTRSQVLPPQATEELDVLPSSPPRSPVTPRRGRRTGNAQASPKRSLGTLPTYLHPYLQAQKRAILKALRTMPELVEGHAGEFDREVDSGPSTNSIAHDQLGDLLKGTVARGEGNSCLLIGPRGSGKTQMIERVIGELHEKPIIVRLSGHVQTNDRLAMREIAWQLAQQTGRSLLSAEAEAELQEGEVDTEQVNSRNLNDEAEDDNPFLDSQSTVQPLLTLTLPPPSHLLALISMIPTLPRPTIVVIDAFDLFAFHARQSLLYCLLDTVQHCRPSSGLGQHGMAVIGVTTRVDTTNLLEKRVKSRFSGRMIRTAGVGRVTQWEGVMKAWLGTKVPENVQGEVEAEHAQEWGEIWDEKVEQLMADENAREVIRETFGLTKDLRMMRRILTSLIVKLSPSAPFISVPQLVAAINAQRRLSRLPFLSDLTYPGICLLIAATHAQTAGNDAFTFEMLHEAFRDQVRATQSAPVQIQGGGIGMIACSRDVLFSAHEQLISLRVFVPTTTGGSSIMGIGREFSKYRCAADRTEVKVAVDKMGKLNLKKWLSKGGAAK